MRMEFFNETDGTSRSGLSHWPFQQPGSELRSPLTAGFHPYVQWLQNSPWAQQLWPRALNHGPAGEVTEGHGDRALPGCRGRKGPANVRRCVAKPCLATPGIARTVAKPSIAKTSIAKPCIARPSIAKPLRSPRSPSKVQLIPGFPREICLCGARKHKLSVSLRQPSYRLYSFCKWDDLKKPIEIKI